MYTKAVPLFMVCDSPLHAGSGSDLGIVDLPIQRERHTGFPKIEASSLKGCLRERFEQVLAVDYTQTGNNRNDVECVFGPESGVGDQDTFAAALGLSDARLLLFPVKSMKGVFAWITCPKILSRFSDDMKLCGVQQEVDLRGIKHDLSIQGSELFIDDAKKLVILESYTFSTTHSSELKKWAGWLSRTLFDGTGNQYLMKKMSSNIIVLSDDDFSDFCELSTEVITRTKIDNETGTVQDGALFTEEYLPSESVLYSLALAAPVFPGNDDERKLSNGGTGSSAVMTFFQETLENDAKSKIQLGANSTLGKGMLSTTLIND